MKPRSFLTHAATVLVTLVVAAWWIDGRWRPGESAPVPQRGAQHPQAPAPAPPSVRVRPTPPESTTPQAVIPPEMLARTDADEQINIRVYAQCNRGVVNITVASVTPGFFDDVVSRGSGSGFLVDRGGHILTNFHVVEDAQAVLVTLFDGSQYEAEVIGTDPSTDLAVVRVDAPADKLFPLSLGDSSQLLVGQKVLAVGNPFGLERTLTTGIISALDRSIRARNRRIIKGIIQTDAAINPGNSGGPLLNTQGEVIGMNTAILSQVGQSAGIGFAVPISSIKRVLPQLIERGFVVRADLGITRVLTTDEGLVVIDLAEDGPAERAGLRPARVRVQRIDRFTARRTIEADILTSIDGKPVKTVEELLTEVESHPPGAVVKVGILRDGRTLEIPVTLGESAPE
jgi:S1-C subfamily serine protease